MAEQRRALLAAGEPAAVSVESLNVEQQDAIRSGRDTTFIWGPPGTGKTRTIGSLATALYGDGRSVLLVSHTKAGVDQALLRIAEQLDPDELDLGRVIRLGETKEPMLTERPELLAQTHSDRRSAELVEERSHLQTERVEQVARQTEIEGPLELATWLPTAPDEIRVRREDLEDLRFGEGALEGTNTQATGLHEQIEALANVAEEAIEAITLSGRAPALEPKLAAAHERLPLAETELVALKPRRPEAERIASEAKRHVPEVVRARRRFEELRLEIPKREPLVVAADAELAELTNTLADATELLAEAAQANAVTRRLRRLPRPEEQQSLTESLQARVDRLSVARNDTVAAVEQLNRGFRGLTRPYPATSIFLSRIAPKKREIEELQSDIERFSAELVEIGDPLGRFRERHKRAAEDVDAQSRGLREQFESITRELGLLRGHAEELRHRVEVPLAARLEMLHRVGAVAEVSATFEAQIGDGRCRASDLLADVSTDRLREELRELDVRLREISLRRSNGLNWAHYKNLVADALLRAGPRPILPSACCLFEAPSDTRPRCALRRAFPTAELRRIA